MGSGQGQWVVAGDFNVVRFKEERKNSLFNAVAAKYFNDFIEEAGLNEYILRGHKFTFRSGQKLSRIDRILVCDEFLSKWSDAVYRALPRLYSYHNPIILYVESKNAGPKRFRFYNSWLDRENFNGVVEKSLSGFSGVGDPDVQLMNKFKKLRADINRWKEENNRKEMEEEISIKTEFQKLDQQVEECSLSEEENWVLAECKRRLEWFQEKVKARPELTCFDIKQVSQNDKDMLTANFSEREIKDVVFSCGDDKSPGPDGFNFRFIKRYWSFFAKDFRDIMVKFYDEGLINKGVGASFITLIPKCKNPVGLGEYRPINLIGVISKVISKVLANRLRVVMSSITSVTQSAFLSGRFILDGLLIINEIMAWAKKNNKRIFLMKIDFEKAYDNVNWDFLLDIKR
ncbi:uncharacterized protein LOC110913282 [Helianthus annuus]|uniref:uncharacterized protein LOC110913282 n=1 Tax=Helianthus annuus TaxID=4232 RepID=UPI000B906644|nr:uncharacterized protein LOC110913282 [Helianthus annuus]